MPPWKRSPSIEEYYRGRVSSEEIVRLQAECRARNSSLHGALMEKADWPAIPYDGQLMSHQDALLMGGKVRAPAGYADHVEFLNPELCEECGTKICIKTRSGQTITRERRRAGFRP